MGCVAALTQVVDNLDATDDSNKTPLHYACIAESVDVVNVMLAAGADPNAADISVRVVWMPC